MPTTALRSSNRARLTFCRPSTNALVCQHGKSSCLQKNPNGREVCTREKGHTGTHVSCGTTTHNIATWR